MEFNPTTTRNAFNKCVDAHKQNGGGRTQLRPKIASIGPRKSMEGRDDYRKLKYETGQEFMMDESSIAGIVHSYTTLVALLTGDFNLVAIPYYFDAAAGPRRKGGPSAALPPGVGFLISMGTGALLDYLGSNKKISADMKVICQSVHDGIKAKLPKVCKK